MKNNEGEVGRQYGGEDVREIEKQEAKRKKP